MSELLTAIAFLLNRYVHIVAMALLVGGTLFYEMILPVAIADFKTEQQLAIVGRARWAFRWLVFWCAGLLLASGIISTYRNWYAYTGDEPAIFAAVAAPQPAKVEGLSIWQSPRTWMIGHGVVSLAGLVIAVSLVIRQRPPEKPVRWMRVSLVILLAAIFLGSAIRHTRLRAMELITAESMNCNSTRLIFVPTDEIESATTQPASTTAPTTVPSR